jgi:type II secretory pathway pseudopilin PulG
MNNGGSIEGTSTVAKLANENPYLLDLYKNKIVELEKQLEHMKLQIRKMIAAEYIQKQKNRLFKEEKHKYLETIDKLQKELEKQIRHSAKIMSNHPPPIMQQQEEDDEQPEQQQHQSHQIKRSSSSSSSSSNSSSSRLARRNTTTLEDIKQLKKRNEYLENRLREILNGSIRNEREEEFDFIGMDEDREEEYKEGKDKEEEEEEEDALEVLRKAQEAYDQENHTPHDDPQEETFFQRQRSKRSLATTTSVSISTQSIGIKLPCNESKNSNISSQQPLQERSSSSTDLKGSTSSNSTSNSYSDSTSSSSVRSIDGELMRQMKARPKTAFVLSSHLRPKNIGGTKSTVIAKSLL